MKKNLMISLLFLTAVSLMCSCARTVLPEEVLQVPEFVPVYTAYNLWYDKKGNCCSENIQKGSILPFGTEIEFGKANTNGIHFTSVKDGRKFYLKYNQGRSIVPIENFIKRLFVLRNEADLALGLRPIVYEKIKRGIVEKGMTRSEVLLAYGPPPAARTPSETVDTWIYWTDRGVTRRIVFFGERVMEIIELH